MALPEIGLLAVIENLSKFESGAKSITKAYDDIDIGTEKVVASSTRMGGTLDILGSGLAKVGSIALGATVAGITAIAGGMVAGAAAGLNFNNAMEQARARLSAFVPDAAEVELILANLRAEADKTPFSFEQMTTAAASLIPAVKESGMSLEELIQTAEILAASNPLEGLEGASFSLREAISGDTTSIVERFNLSRSTINQFKDEGMTAFEAVIATMNEMGLTSELVSNLANTLTGRWSTFTDTLVTFFGVATQPLFDKLSSGLGDVNTLIEANRPLINELANTLAGAVSSAITLVVDWSGKLSTAWTLLNDFIAVNLTPRLNELGLILSQFWAEILPPLQEAWTTLRLEWQNNVAPALAELIAAFGVATGDVDLWQIALDLLKAVLDLVVFSVKLLTPEIKLLSATITGVVDAFTFLVDLTSQTLRGFDSLAGTVIDLSKKVSDFSKSLLAIVLPDWLMPGSPTPFELGLIGIGTAVTEQVDPSLTTLGGTLDTVFLNWGNLVTDTRKDMLLLRDDVTKVDTSLVTMNLHILNIGTSFNLVAIASNTLIQKVNQIASSLTTVKESADSAVKSMNALVAISFSSLSGQIDNLRGKVDDLAGAFDEAESKAKDLKNVSFSPMQSALDTINSTIGKIIESFNAMAEAANAAANAANGATDSSPTSGLALGGLATQMIPGTVSGPAVVNNVTNNYYDMNNDFGGNTINGQFDQARFDQMVLQSIQRLMR